MVKTTYAVQYKPAKVRKAFVCILLLVLVGGFLIGCRKSAPSTSRVDQSTLEKTVQSLVEAQNRGDWQTVRALVKPGDKDSEPYLEQFEKFTRQGGQSQTTDVKIDLVEVTATMARIQVRGHVKVIAANKEVLSDYDTGDRLSLVKIEEYWYFVGLGQPIPPGWIQSN